MTHCGTHNQTKSLLKSLTLDIGFFPNTVIKPTRKLYEYDVAEEAAQMIASDG